MRKSDKSELLSELKSMKNEEVPVNLPSTNDERAVIIDLMAYARKVPIKKKILKSYNDLLKSLWILFSPLLPHATALTSSLMYTKKTA